jgi:cholest-4-en-3-one 26-monooxygenase
VFYFKVSWEDRDMSEPKLEFDIFDPDIHVEGIPHEAYRRMRVEAPVYWHHEPGGRGYWAVMKYEDVVAISRDPGTYSSQRGATFIKDHEGDDLSAMQMMMVNMDPPQHVRFRNLVKHAFAPASVRALEPKIRGAVRRIVDNVARKGRCDFVRDVAQLLPLEVIADMIGVPHEDRERIFEWSNCMVGMDDPEVQQNFAHAQAAAMQMWQYAGELGQARFDKPGDDLISMLMKGVAEGGLSAMEFASFFMLLFVAGNETTRNLIAGGMQALIEHPEERERLMRDPETLLPTAVEEMLRWVSPLVYFRRTATRDVVLRGQQIKENDKVVMYYGSANRDEAVFPDPYRFDVGRTPNDHLAFGVGQHWCLGAGLARLEIKLMFEELLKRLPDIQLDGPVKRLRSNFLNATKSMPVKFKVEQKRAMP